MPMYDYVCTKGHVFEALAGVGEETRPCAVCAGGKEAHSRDYPPSAVEAAFKMAHDLGARGVEDGVGHRVLLAPPASLARKANPLGIVVHRDVVTGEYRFPGHANAPVPAGCERVEVTSTSQARAIEKQVAERESAKERENRYRQEAHFSQVRKAEADDLRSKMGDFSEVGKKLAAAALEMAQEREKNRQRPVGHGINAGFEALSYDRSNREAHADATTGWKKKAE